MNWKHRVCTHTENRVSNLHWHRPWKRIVQKIAKSALQRSISIKSAIRKIVETARLCSFWLHLCIRLKAFYTFSHTLVQFGKMVNFNWLNNLHKVIGTPQLLPLNLAWVVAEIGFETHWILLIKLWHFWEKLSSYSSLRWKKTLEGSFACDFAFTSIPIYLMW